MWSDCGALCGRGHIESRQVATRVLGRQGDLDNVPILIFVLTDPDLADCAGSAGWPAADQSQVRWIRIAGGSQKADVEALVGRWKTWYKSVRPEGALIE